uniref:Phytanoyl-CoA dioxygenase n=1 Tax=viral metagenome TaxID=1070528 RepID=A0A6C0BWG6_9ZZZZ
MNVKQQLAANGYAIVEKVLSPDEIELAKEYFYNWIYSSAQLIKLHNAIDPHGIFKFGEVGHQKHAWFIRTRDAVQAPFREIWGTDELITSFDGSCWIPSGTRKADKIWTHTDQAPNNSDFQCVQSFVALTENKSRTLVVYEGSHLLHAEYMKLRGLTGTKNWQPIDYDYLKSIEDRKRTLHVKAGSLVLWDSRTFHQNQYGPDHEEERIVQYTCFLPRAHPKNTPKMVEKRLKYLDDRRTTSHWPCPIHVNGLQPQNYGNPDLVIDYSKLDEPDLSEFEDDILRLV